LHLLVVMLIGVLAFFVNRYRDNAITYKDQRDKAVVRANTSEAITNNVITAMNLIRDISKATQNAKNELAQKATRIVYIRQALQAIRALTSLFLLPLLTACGNTQTVYVPAPVVPISPDLTAETPIPGMAVPFTWQASLELNAQLYTALGQCNLDKAGIRKIEEARKK
jgi:hypothetical protein